jgi:signal transduction histidine kinase
MSVELSRLTAVVAAMDVAVFERRSTDDIEPVVDLPAWFVRAWAVDDQTTGTAPTWLARSDFLARFLDEAAELLSAAPEGRLTSGPWSESTLDSGETQFEATAIASGGRQWLIVERLGPRNEQRRASLRSSRERNLFLEQLVAAHEDRFILLDCIVHDMAGPLQGIRGCLELLRYAGSREDVGEWIERTLRQVEKQEGLIDDVLRYFGPPTAGPTRSEEVTVKSDVAVCAADVVESLAPSAEAHGKRLALGEDVDPACLLPVTVPATELERVIGNLVLNALRVTPPQSTVVVGVRADGPDVVVTVDDEGPGVPSAQAQAVFERRARFTQGGRAGLGLYFARRAVESWGGVIGHFSLGERGSRFWFRLPLARD